MPTAITITITYNGNDKLRFLIGLLDVGGLLGCCCVGFGGGFGGGGFGGGCDCLFLSGEIGDLADEHDDLGDDQDQGKDVEEKSGGHDLVIVRKFGGKAQHPGFESLWSFVATFTESGSEEGNADKEHATTDAEEDHVHGEVEVLGLASANDVDNEDGHEEPDSDEGERQCGGNLLGKVAIVICGPHRVGYHSTALLVAVDQIASIVLVLLSR